MQALLRCSGHAALSSCCRPHGSKMPIGNRKTSVQVLPRHQMLEPASWASPTASRAYAPPSPPLFCHWHKQALAGWPPARLVSRSNRINTTSASRAEFSRARDPHAHHAHQHLQVWLRRVQRATTCHLASDSISVRPGWTWGLLASDNAGRKCASSRAGQSLHTAARRPERVVAALAVRSSTRGGSGGGAQAVAQDQRWSAPGLKDADFHKRAAPGPLRVCPRHGAPVPPGVVCGCREASHCCSLHAAALQPRGGRHDGEATQCGGHAARVTRRVVSPQGRASCALAGGRSCSPERISVTGDAARQEAGTSNSLGLRHSSVCMRAGPPPCSFESNARSSSTVASNAAICRLRACQQHNECVSERRHQMRSQRAAYLHCLRGGLPLLLERNDVFGHGRNRSPGVSEAGVMHALLAQHLQPGTRQPGSAARHSHRPSVPNTTCLIFLQAPALQPGAFELGLEDLYVFQGLWIQEVLQCSGGKHRRGPSHLRYSLLKSLVLLRIQRLLAPVSAAHGDRSGQLRVQKVGA